LSAVLHPLRWSRALRADVDETRASVDQDLRDVGVALRGSPHQRRVSTLSSRIHIGAGIG
jgi:hypothetical protein